MTTRPRAKTQAARRHRPMPHLEVSQTFETMSQIGLQPLMHKRKQLSF